MPFRPTAEVEARRAAAREATEHPTGTPPVTALPQPRPSAAIDPPPRVRPPTAPPSSSLPMSPRQRGHATRDENNKWQPTGDYATGFCRPPQATRFKKGGKPGPGRPKGSVSHDTLIKRQLDQKQRVRINGREKNVSLRELIATKTLMAAVDGKDRDARKFALAESARLYAAADDRGGAGSGELALNASDALSIDEFMTDLRREIRAEIERELAAGKDGTPE